MITILHGDNILASRQALESVKLTAKGKEIFSLEGKGVDLTMLKQALEAKSLFAEEKLVVIEDLLTANSLQLTAGFIDYLKRGEFDADLVLWEEKALPTGILSKLKKVKGVKIELFKQPAIIFSFLDSLKPGNTKAMLASLLRSMEVLKAEIVFYMLVRQFRMLLAVKAMGMEHRTYNIEHEEREGGEKTTKVIEEVKKLAPWQLGKLKKQTSYFTLDALLKIYKELLIIDYQVKTGKSALDLTKRIGLFIMSL